MGIGLAALVHCPTFLRARYAASTTSTHPQIASISVPSVNVVHLSACIRHFQPLCGHGDPTHIAIYGQGISNQFIHTLLTPACKNVRAGDGTAAFGSLGTACHLAFNLRPKTSHLRNGVLPVQYPTIAMNRALWILCSRLGSLWDTAEDWLRGTYQFLVS